MTMIAKMIANRVTIAVEMRMRGLAAPLQTRATAWIHGAFIINGLFKTFFTDI